MQQLETDVHDINVKTLFFGMLATVGQSSATLTTVLRNAQNAAA